MAYKHIDGVQVEVENVVYMPTLPSSANKPYPFVYFITIHNQSDQEIQILGRKWVVDEDDSGSLIVEGDGVVGETPIIPPGDSFSYNSYHVIAKDAEVHGAFYGKTSAGEVFSVIIPAFHLKKP